MLEFFFHSRRGDLRRRRCGSIEGCWKRYGQNNMNKKDDGYEAAVGQLSAKIFESRRETKSRLNSF